MEEKKTVYQAIELAMRLTAAARYAEAESVFRQILTQIPDLPEANHGLGVTCHLAGKDVDAIIFLKNAVKLRPDRPDFRIDLATAFRCANLPDLALEELETVLAADSKNERAMVERGYNLWLKGDLSAAFAARKAYREAYPGYFRRLPGQLWAGEAVKDRTVLLQAEQGLGDSLIFLRYAPMLRELGARVVLMLHDPLLRLAENCLPDFEILPLKNPPPECDFHCPMMELPRLFKTGLDTIPAPIPYIHPHPGDVALWKAKLGPKRGLRVGLVWSGNPEQVENHRRSMPLSAMAPLSGIPGVEYFSLQKGPGAAEAASPPPGLVLRDETERLFDMADTAALMANLDLVISVDTSTAHLAGAMGVPCWVPLCSTAYYFYMLEREDCPWYPSMRLFRQAVRGEWGPVMERMAAELGELAKRSRGI